MRPDLGAALLLLIACGSAPPPPAPALGPPMNFGPPAPPADPLPVVDGWEDLPALNNQWAEVQGVLVVEQGGKTPTLIPLTYLQLADGTEVSIGAPMPAAWEGLLNQKIAVVGVVTACRTRQVSQWHTGPFIEQWETARVLEVAPEVRGVEEVKAAWERVNQGCR